MNINVVVVERDDFDVFIFGRERFGGRREGRNVFGINGLVFGERLADADDGFPSTSD